jgi:ElaB/YqjD/DUF883 family membrane-anchored ribosome-binding protein
MTDGEIHQVSSELGSLKTAVEMMTDTWKAQELSASEGRRSLHAKFDDVRNEVTKLAGRVDEMSRDITEIKPAIEVFKSARERQLGAQWMGKLIWVAFIGIAGAAGAFIAQLLHIKLN